MLLTSADRGAESSYISPLAPAAMASCLAEGEVPCGGLAAADLHRCRAHGRRRAAVRGRMVRCGRSRRLVELVSCVFCREFVFGKAGRAYNLAGYVCSFCDSSRSWLCVCGLRVAE